MCAVATQLLGFGADAGALAGFFGYLTAVVQHMNIRHVPLWDVVRRSFANGMQGERRQSAFHSIRRGRGPVGGALP